MDDTPNLDLPYLAAAQAQKHVTHNEALRRLDAVVQLCVADADRTAPPASPSEGQRHIVAAGATGVWTGKDGQVAMWRDGAWGFSVPQPGWLAWVEADGALSVRAAAVWEPFAQNQPLVGVNAAADGANRLAVASDASLFTHAGSDHRLKLNKAAAADTGSILYQRGYSGRAEIGLTGDDDLHVKVSADGSAWTEALTVRGADGRVSAGAALRLKSATLAALPSATTAGAGALLYLTDETGGATPVFSDGTAWRRVSDRAVAS